MTTEEIKDELFRMLSDIINGSCPIRNNAQRGRYREVIKSVIKFLDQNEDCISRQEMLKYFESWKNQIKYYHPYAKNFDIPYEEAIQRIKDVPPVKYINLENSNRWTPISEGLPKKDKYSDYYKCLVAVACTSRSNTCETFTAYFDGKHFYKNQNDLMFISGVKAWMPLPEPYEFTKER